MSQIKKLSIQEKRNKAKRIINSLKGVPLSDAKEIITFFCPLAINNKEEELLIC